MKKVFKFVKGKKDEKREGAGITQSQSRDLSSPDRTPDDEKFPTLDAAPGYIVDFCGRDKTLTKLHKAAWQGHLEKLKAALKKVEIDAVDRHNRSALHLAVARGHPNIVWYLLGNDAKMTICDGDGCTPLLKAIECGNKECMTLLLERGADVNHADYRGNTGLHVAAGQGTLDIATMLLSKGALVNVANNCGEYPLHIATRSQNKDLVELLLRGGASVNVFDRENRTPLMLAAKTGNLLLARIFCDYGAQMSVIDSNGWTAEDYALLGGHQSVADKLKSRAANGNSEQNGEIRPQAIGPDVPSGSWNGDEQPTSMDSNGRKHSRTKKLDGRYSGREKEDDLSDSPASETMPPPCQPPKSWELIQAGMIDENQDGGESKRRSITALGTLRTRRESFTDTSSNQGDSVKYTLSLNRRKPVKRENSFAKQRFSFNEEESLRSRISDGSTTLKEIDKMQLENIRTIEGSNAKTREVSLTSDWDSDCSSIHIVRGTELQKSNEDKLSGDGSMSRTEALNGIDEIWVANSQIERPASTNENSSWDSEELSGQVDESRRTQPPFFASVETHFARETSPHKLRVETVWRSSYENQSHSLDLLDDRQAGNLDRPPGKRHTRQHSVSGHKWRSEEIPQGQKYQSADRLVDVNRRINEQLQCYDQALRELASAGSGPVTTPDEASDTHDALSTSKPQLQETSPDSQAQDGYYYTRTKPVVNGSGPPSLPFCVNSSGVTPKSDGSENSKESGSGAKEDRAQAKKSKRHMLLAMRDVKHAIQVAHGFRTSVDEQILSPLTKPADGSASDDEEEERFFRSDFNCNGRQETVIEKTGFRRKSSSSGTGEESTLWLQEEPKGPDSQPHSEEEVPDVAEEGPKFSEGDVGLALPGDVGRRARRDSSSSDEASPRKDSNQDGAQNRPVFREAPSPDVSFSSGPIDAIGGIKDSGSEADSSHNEVSPAHNYTLQSHHEWLKNHLKTTTTEKNKLEQVAVELSEKAERLEYELADAKEATKSKDEVISLLQNQLSRMEIAYTKSLEESVQSRLQLTSHEQEILHLKELCFRYEEEKEKEKGKVTGASCEDDSAVLRSRIRILEEEKETMQKDLVRLEQEKSALEKRLQEATTSEIIDQCQRWKERYENLEESVKANDEAQSAYLSYMKSLSEEHLEREKKLTERNLELEKMLMEAKEKNVELDVKLQSRAADADESHNNNLKSELNRSLAEIEKQNLKMESEIRKLQRDMEEKSLKMIKEKEEEMQTLIRQFTSEREALVRMYECRLAEKKADSSDLDGEHWRRENETLRLTVKNLQEKFAELQMKSSTDEANETVKSELSMLKDMSKSIIEIQNKGKQELGTLMKENLSLKKEVNELKMTLLRDDPAEGGSKGVAEDKELRGQIRFLRDTLDEERKAMQEYKEKNARLEQQVKKLTADAKQGSKPEVNFDVKPNKKRGVGKEDELAWTNLYGIKLTGKSREGLLFLDDFLSKNESSPTERSRLGREDPKVLDCLPLDNEREKTRKEVRQRLNANFRAEEEAEAKRILQSCELLELKRQIILLQDRMADENSTRRTLETKLVEMDQEVREKQRLEMEVDALRRKIASDLVPRSEIDLLKRQLELQARRTQQEQQDPGDDAFREDYRAKCERYAREMEKSKEIRKKIETDFSSLGSSSQQRLDLDQKSPFREEAPVPSRPPPGQMHSVGDLEPEIKSRLNEELEKSIKRHLTDLPTASDTNPDVLGRKLLQ